MAVKDIWKSFFLHLFPKVLGMCYLVAPRSHQMGIKASLIVKFYQKASCCSPPVLCTMLQQSRNQLSATSALGSLNKKGRLYRRHLVFTPCFLTVRELCQPVSTCGMKGGAWLTAHYKFWFPDASPGDFHSCACQTGRSFKQQGLSHQIVLLWPKRAEMSPHEPSEDAAEQHCSLSIWRSHRCGTQGRPYQVVAMKPWDVSGTSLWSHSGGSSLLAQLQVCP